MNQAAHLELSTNRCIAYHSLPAESECTNLPGVIFLGGFKSDMTGTKAVWLENWCRTRGRAFIRFDYRGHGASSGRFEDGCIGDWADDAAEVLRRVATVPQILVGSSMGGWIALLLASRFPDRVAALVGIAAAPDFTEDGLPNRLTAEQRAEIEQTGQVALRSAYSDEPYVYTRRLIADGRNHLVLRSPLALHCPVHLLHGTADPDVPTSVAHRLFDHLTAPQARLTLIKDGDHRLSDRHSLTLLGEVIDGLTDQIGTVHSLPDGGPP